MSPWIYVAHMVCSFFAAFSFCVLFNVPKSCYFLGGLNGMFGWMCVWLLSEPTSPAMGSFVGALVTTFCARLFSYLKKQPSTDFLIPGIIPLVPGAGVYYTAFYFVTKDFESYRAKGVESIGVAFAIVVGMVAIFSLPGKWFAPPLPNKKKDE